MERLGIPTASIITHVFLNTAKAMTRMMGVPEYEFVVAQHPQCQTFKEASWRTL